MEQDHIQFALQRRDGMKQLREVSAAAQHQNVVSTLAGLGDGIRPDGSLSARFV